MLVTMGGLGRGSVEACYSRESGRGPGRGPGAQHESRVGKSIRLHLGTDREEGCSPSHLCGPQTGRESQGSQSGDQLPVSV